MDYFSQLAVEVNEHIRHYLSLADIYCLSQVSKLQHYYTKSFFTQDYTAIIYTGYASCLYHDPTVASVASLLLPLLNFPLATRFYKVTVAGKLTRNGRLGGKISVSMAEMQLCPYDDDIAEWQDDETMDNVKRYQQQRQRRLSQPGSSITNTTTATTTDHLYFDEWLDEVDTVDLAMLYDSYNNCSSFNRRQYRHKLVDVDIWRKLEATTTNQERQIEFSLAACYNSLSSVIYIKQVSTMANVTFSTIKLVTDGYSLIRTVIFHYKFADYDDSIYVVSYQDNRYLSDMWYQYKQRVLNRLNYSDANSTIEYRWNINTYKPNTDITVWICCFPKTGEAYSLPVDERLKRQFTLEDDNLVYDNCHSLQLLVAKNEHLASFNSNMSSVAQFSQV